MHFSFYAFKDAQTPSDSKLVILYHFSSKLARIRLIYEVSNY